MEKNFAGGARSDEEKVLRRTYMKVLHYLSNIYVLGLLSANSWIATFKMPMISSVYCT